LGVVFQEDKEEIIMRLFGHLTFMATGCVAVSMLVMAAQPAPAQQWQLPDYGRNHGVVGGPGMPKCNMAVSEECRRLYGGAKRPSRLTGFNQCIYNYVMNRRGDPRVDRLAAETTRRGGTVEAANTLRGTREYRSVLLEAKGACGVR
jgi:hypothetical protein